MSDFWRRHEDEHLGSLAGKGCSIKHMAFTLGRTAKDVTARMARLGYDLGDVDTATRRRVADLRKSGSSVGEIAQETGLHSVKVTRILALRGVEWKDAPPPPAPYVDPWDEPRPRSTRPTAAPEWPF